MSVTIKRQNHRLHPCADERKPELLRHLIDTHQGRTILVVASDGTDIAIDSASLPNVTVYDDTALSAHPDLRCDLLISYDLPEKALLYINRLMRSDSHALALINDSDQKKLYPIEVLLGRTILQETVPGFESKPATTQQEAKKPAQQPRKERQNTRDDAPRTDKKRPFKHDKKESGHHTKKEGGKSVYLGKDENGKPIFSGKTRERNHYIDGTPRSEAEKAAKSRYSSKPKFYAKEKNDSGNPATEKKEVKPADKKQKTADKGKNASAKFSSDKGKKPYGGDKGKAGTDKKPSPPAPKRTPKRITVKSLDPSKPEGNQ